MNRLKLVFAESASEKRLADLETMRAVHIPDMLSETAAALCGDPAWPARFFLGVPDAVYAGEWSEEKTERYLLSQFVQLSMWTAGDHLAFDTATHIADLWMRDDYKSPDWCREMDMRRLTARHEAYRMLRLAKRRHNLEAPALWASRAVADAANLKPGKMAEALLKGGFVKREDMQATLLLFMGQDHCAPPAVAV